jgi:hypothetical protein
MALFDQAIEKYEEALSGASRIGDDAECSVMKSELLAYHGKLRFAEKIEEYDIANATEEAMESLKQKGSELGACFNQSEAMRIVTNEGLNYTPSLPLNMTVFLEGKKQELSAWKRLPVSEQEPVVDQNIMLIDALIAEYGEDAAAELEPLKNEMLAAKEAGFTEPEPDMGGPGEPNSLY